MKDGGPEEKEELVGYVYLPAGIMPNDDVTHIRVCRHGYVLVCHDPECKKEAIDAMLAQREKK